MVYIFTIQKFSPYWGPLQPFLNIDHDFGHICFLKKLWNFFGTKSGSYSGQKIISFSFGVFFDWEISIYFCPLFVHFRTLWNTLTYSALMPCSMLQFLFQEAIIEIIDIFIITFNVCNCSRRQKNVSARFAKLKKVLATRCSAREHPGFLLSRKDFFLVLF